MKVVSKVTLMAALVASASSSVFAAEDGWSGQGEAGLTVVSGNSDSEILTAGLDFGKKSGQWEHSAKLSILKSESTDSTGESNETADSLLVGWVSKYLLSERSYVFGDLRYLDDDFDSFEAIKTYAVGYGYKAIISDDVNWDISAGIGYRETEYTDEAFAGAAGELDDQDLGAATLVLGSLYSNKLTDNTEFTNETRVEATDDNTYAQNIASLSVSMSDNLALKLKYDVRHNTDPAPFSTSTDKITSVNVVYKF